jgi:hypothetical protein
MFGPPPASFGSLSFVSPLPQLTTYCDQFLKSRVIVLPD